MTDSCPKGFATVTPSVSVKNCAKAIETYKKAFGAKEIARIESPDGSKKIMHAVIEIGNSKIMMSDEFPGCPSAAAGGTAFYVYVDDCDSTIKQAKGAGLKETMPAEDMFWGDRLGAVNDEFGIQWSVATHKREVSPAELEKGAKDMMERMKKGAKAA